MSEITKRIYGTEFEWPPSGTVKGIDSDTTPTINLYSKLQDYIDPKLTMVGGMMSNGSRFYTDCGHLEYATPEDTTIEGAVLREIAGERIVMDTLTRIVKDGFSNITSAYLRKRVIDDAGTTWGYHINLLANPDLIRNFSDETMHLMGLHIATAQPIIGAGVVRGIGNNSYYSFGQKVLDLQHDYSVNTLNDNKPLINQRDESLSDRKFNKRVHLTSLDAHISPWATKMTIGTCSLILRAIEQGVGKEIRVPTENIKNPLVQLAKTSATDLTMNKAVYLADGSSTTALGLQEMLIEAASKTEHTDEEAVLLEEWRRAIADLQQEPMLLRDRSDAIARYSLIRSLNIKRGASAVDMSTPFARVADGYYDRVFEIGSERFPIDGEDQLISYLSSHAHKLRSGMMQDHMPSEAAIQDAVYNPPTATRAYGRGRAIATGNVQYAQWDRYTYNDGTRVEIPDPHETDLENKKVE